MGPVPKKQDKGETPAAGKLRTKKEYGLTEDGETNGTGAEPFPSARSLKTERYQLRQRAGGAGAWLPLDH